MKGRLKLKQTKLPELSLSGSHTGPIDADSINVTGDVFLRDGFHADGEVRLLGATIGGQLSCTSGHFISPLDKDGEPIGSALTADGINVTGGVFLNGINAEGEVRLAGATIGGQLNCSSGHFISALDKDGEPIGSALTADGIDVKGSVFLTDGFVAHGEVRLNGAAIGGQLSCTDGKFSNPNGCALNADSINVKGSVFLTDGFQAKGEVRLLGAAIGGQFACKSGKFINPKGYALNAEGINVKGDVFLRGAFLAAGRLDFVGAAITGHFVCASDKESVAYAPLDLRNANIATYRDKEDRWPSQDNLQLSGLVYKEFGHDTDATAETRLKWLRLQPKEPFHTQPYEQLAKVLEESGDERGAAEVRFAKSRDLMQRTKMGFRLRFWYWIVRLTIGFGHKPWRATYFAAGFILLGWLIFCTSSDVMVPTNVAGRLVNGASASQVSKDYPKFRPIIYSIDAFVPLVDLHQATYWLPANRCVWVYLWVHTAFGWILTTLLVLALSGLIRK